ncbi:MAG: helix-turn-helix domain-containing protein [Clostridiales bacterium]|nr:helix-turn-helix domain-containing protein [Clostridiales bacterium]
MENFGSKIKRLRQEKNLSIVEAALKLDINKGSLSRYENNLVEPSFGMAVKIARLYGVSLDYLASED